MLTRATEYSLLAVLRLAESYPAEVVTKRDLCDAEGIPPAFLTKILQPLIRAGVIRSRRGAAGGFLLARDPEGLTLFEVMQVAGEPLGLNLCMLGGPEHAPTCTRRYGCPVHGLWAEATAELRRIFGARSVAELARERAARREQ